MELPFPSLAVPYLCGVLLTIILFAAGATLGGRRAHPRPILLALGLLWPVLLLWRLVEMIIDVMVWAGTQIGWSLAHPITPTPIPATPRHGAGSATQPPDHPSSSRIGPHASPTPERTPNHGPRETDSSQQPSANGVSRQESSSAPSGSQLSPAQLFGTGVSHPPLSPISTSPESPALPRRE